MPSPYLTLPNRTQSEAALEIEMSKMRRNLIAAGFSEKEAHKCVLQTRSAIVTNRQMAGMFERMISGGVS